MAEIFGSTTTTPLNPDVFSDDVDLTNYVKNTDYATADGNGGIVKVTASSGININNNGVLYVNPAYSSDIAKKSSQRLPIVPHMLDYAVKVGLTTNQETWSEEERQSARDLIGVSEIIGDIDAALDNIIEIQEELICIKFTFGKALKGMTWREWLESSYYLDYLNSLIFEVDAFHINDRNQVVNKIGDPINRYENGVNYDVYADDVILAGNVYAIG